MHRYRDAHIVDFCVLGSDISRWSAIYDMKNRLLCCSVRGCGSTAWKQFLLYLNGRLVDPSLELPVDDFYDNGMLRVTDLETATLINENHPPVSFLFVRYIVSNTSFCVVINSIVIIRSVNNIYIYIVVHKI